MKKDARSLPLSVQEEIRKKAVKAYLSGSPVSDLVRIFDVSRPAIYKWIRKYRKGGMAALKTEKQGRPLERGKLLGWQVHEAKSIILKRTPDEIGLPFSLWTREAVGSLLEMKYNITQSRWSIGRLLSKWGFTPQKPAKQAREQNPSDIKKWIKRQYPLIRSSAHKEKAEIHWGDEMGLRSDHQTGRSYGLKGKTPIVRKTGRRFSANMISTLTNRGTLRFMVFTKRFTADTFLIFLRRLIRDANKKIFLIIDGHPVHKAKRVEQWLERKSSKIKIFSPTLLSRT